MSQLLAGAARCCITPPLEMLKQICEQEKKYSFNGIYEDIYVRVIVLSDGMKRSALISADLNRFPNQNQMCDRLWQLYGIDPLSCVFGCTRNHMAPNGTCKEENPPTGKHKTMGEALTKYIDFVHNAAMKAVETAIDAMEPAKMGYSSIKSNINAARGWASAPGNLETENPNGYSDKTLIVMCVRDLSDQVIGVFVNYGMRGCMLHGNLANHSFPMVNGDLPAAISQFVENAGNNKYPVLWTAGGACDQNPAIMSSWKYWKVGQSKEMELSEYTMPVETSRAVMERLACIQGMDILKAVETITQYKDEFVLWAGETYREIPGRVSYHALGYQDFAEERPEPVPAKPLKLRLRLCVICGMAFAGINGEVYSRIAGKIRDMVPCVQTAILDTSYGHLGCIPDAEGEKENTYAVMDSCCYCARSSEEAIIGGFQELAGNYLEEMRRDDKSKDV